MENLADVDHITACWSDLPVDVLIVIMRFITPNDILALRKVSKSISHITRERSVWIDALRRVSIQHDVYAPSFTLTEMSINELEYAATACRRFSSHLRNEFLQHRTVWPLYTQYLEPTAGRREDFDHLRFLPGGRFLLTSCGCTLQLWDLGNRSNRINTTPIASLEIDGVAKIRSVRTRACDSGPEVLVFVSSTGFESTFCLHVFTVFPPAPTPQFNLLAPVFQLAQPIYIDLPSILGTTSKHVAVCTGSSTVLWDFIEDSWISWPQEPTNFDNTFYLCNDNVVILHADETEVYLAELPALHPRSISTLPPQIESLRILQCCILCHFKQPKLLESCVSGITLPFHGRETSTFEQPLYIDILSDDDSKTLLTHFALVPTSQTDTAARCKLIALGESPLDAAYRSSHSFHLEWVGRHDIQSFVVDGSTLHGCLSHVDGETSSSVSGIIATPGLPANEVNVDFCSFSGRVCARVPNVEGGFRVAVMDYLLPKPTHYQLR
ncbi:hypothetical protein C8R44DRAFT_767599 [Mycena epipterygia]|nr:hypothetical protein C8R44DRAFT_767599 [Mycena epipterygia]